MADGWGLEPIRFVTSRALCLDAIISREDAKSPSGGALSPLAFGIPAQAGDLGRRSAALPWVPAFAGMTKNRQGVRRRVRSLCISAEKSISYAAAIQLP